MDFLQTLPLTHSWPVLEQGHHFDHGFVHGCDTAALSGPTRLPLDPRMLAERGIGLWECDLGDDSLTWSGEVYDIFGLPRDFAVSRAAAVALYLPEPRATMERLRSYAIKHRRGFTLDVELQPVGRRRRWMRLMAAPVCIGGRAVRLHGVKQDVSRDYV